MLGRSVIALDRVIDYNKQPDGSWHADLYRPIRLHVEGLSTMECRTELHVKFDEAVAEWLERIHKQRQDEDTPAIEAHPDSTR